MKKRLEIRPDGWPCTYGDCRPGFFLNGEYLCLKSEYGGDGYNEAGEAFWGGVSGALARDSLVVQPVEYIWVEEES